MVRTRGGGIYGNDPACSTARVGTPSPGGSALHVMLFFENVIRALLIFNGLRSRYCQRALLVYHYLGARLGRTFPPQGVTWWTHFMGRTAASTQISFMPTIACVDIGADMPNIPCHTLVL